MCAAFAALIFAVFPASGQTAESEAEPVAAWLDREMEAAAAPLTLASCRLMWRTEYVGLPASSEIAALRAAVRGTPGHPEEQRLAQIESTLRGKPPAVTSTLWYGGPGYWRYNTDEPERSIVFDHVSTASSAWQVSSSRPGTATLKLQPGTERHSAGGKARSDEQAFIGELSRMLEGGLRNIAGWRRTGLTVTRDSWEAQYEPGLNQGADRPMFRVRVRGDWSAAHARGFVREYQVTLTPMGDGGDRFVIEGWGHEPVLDRWVARTVHRFGQDGKPTVVYRFLGAEPEPTGTLERITQSPGLNEADSYRTSLVVTAIDDRSEGKLVSLRDGARVEVPSEPVPVGSAGLRFVGWILAGIIACTAGVIAWVRWRRAD